MKDKEKLSGDILEELTELEKISEGDITDMGITINMFGTFCC